MDATLARMSPIKPDTEFGAIHSMNTFHSFSGFTTAVVFFGAISASSSSVLRNATKYASIRNVVV